MSIRKTLFVKDNVNGITTYYDGKTFKEVLADVKGRNVEIWLQREDADKKYPMFYNFTSEALIGNAASGLTQEDYYKAYDKII